MLLDGPVPLMLGIPVVVLAVVVGGTTGLVEVVVAEVKQLPSYMPSVKPKYTTELVVQS